LNDVIKRNSTKYRAKEIKACFANEFHKDSAYNTLLRTYNEFILLAHQHGQKLESNKRFLEICRDMNALSKSRIKPFSNISSHDLVNSFKLQAYQLFNQIVQRETGTSSCDTEN